MKRIEDMSCGRSDKNGRNFFAFISFFIIRIGLIVAPTPEYEVCIVISVEDDSGEYEGESYFDIYSTAEDYETAVETDNYDPDCETVVYHKNGTHEHCFDCPEHTPLDSAFLNVLSGYSNGGNISITSAKLKISTKLANGAGGFDISQKTSAACKEETTGKTEFYVS